jgi:PAS domain S-box-containing protein
MIDFYFDSAAVQQDAEAALKGLALDQSSVLPILGARVADTNAPPKILFANKAMLALFKAPNLDLLAKRLFSATDPGAKRLAALGQNVQMADAPRLERLRFYFGAATQIFTFACRWIAGRDQVQIFAATVLDAPPYLLKHPVPAAKQPDALVSPPIVEEVSKVPAPALRETKAVRFLWRTDAEDRFIEVTPPLTEIVGKASADLIGRTLRQVSEMLRLDPHEDLARAFAKRETWSGIEVKWPIAGTASNVPVGLGALPSFDRDKRFEGYHGFGVIYVDRISPCPSEFSSVLTSEPPASAPVPPPAPEQAKPVTAFWMASPYERENVVLLRPLGVPTKTTPIELGEKQTLSPPETLIVPAEPFAPASPPLPAGDLSVAEQTAFHEIGRALTSENSQVAIPSDKAIAPALSGTHEIFEPRAVASENVPAETIQPDDEPAPVVEPVAPQQHASPEMQQLIRNGAVIFEHLNAGVLVSRNEEPVFINRFLLDLLGYENLEAVHLGGGIPRLLAQPSKAGSTTVELTTREGHLVPLIAREQCVDWDDLPSTLMILQPTEGSEVHSSAEARFAQYETESRELHAIIDTATDGVAVLDAAGRILTLNRSGEALFGYDQNEVVGEPFSVLFDAQSRAIAEDYLEGLKTNAVKSLLNDGREIVGRARQGGSIPIFMTLGRVSSSHAEEKDLKFCALLRDMTHWKKVEQELDAARQGAERASALKSDFLAKVSHEIRTPLNAILGFAEVIMDERFGPIGNERYKDYLKDIHMSGAHVMSLVNDLLDLSKIEAGKLELNFHAVDANRIISECVAIMQPQANRERVIMRMSLASNLPAISADERSLRQIILNLLSNAVKFNEPGGQVIIATASSDTGHAIIRIRDTGIGMSEEDIETALEPFRQVATARQTSGTGLGLPLTKALVEANHAFFSIKSKKQEGTLVEVTFPVMRVSA